MIAWFAQRRFSHRNASRETTRKCCFCRPFLQGTIKSEASASSNDEYAEDFDEDELNKQPITNVQALVFTDECHTNLRHKRPGKIPLYVGDNKAVLICSGPMTSTPWHFEDNLLAAVNYSCIGFKLWEVVSPREGMEYWHQCLRSSSADAIKLFDKLEYTPMKNHSPLSKHTNLFLQVPGMLIYTLPGFALHSTIASGLSVAIAANLFANNKGIAEQADGVIAWATKTPGADTKSRIGTMLCLKEKILYM